MLHRPVCCTVPEWRVQQCLLSGAKRCCLFIEFLKGFENELARWMLETWLQSDQIQKGSVVLVSNQVCLAVLSLVFREHFTCECFSAEVFLGGGEVLVELHSGKMEWKGRRVKVNYDRLFLLSI